MNDEKRVNIVILGCNPYLATIFVSKMSSAFSLALTGVQTISILFAIKTMLT